MAHYSPSLLCDETDLYDYDTAPVQTRQSLTDRDLFWENEELVALFSKEQGNPLGSCLQNDPFLGELRGESVDWISSVVGYYGFCAETGVLAVNYLDRFLGKTEVGKREKPWMMHLVAVACLSLAAKMEETRVPLLLDLQVQESRYVFEAKTIQRMEILVLTTLDWKMNPVTPISFIDHFTRRLGFKNHFCCDFLTKCKALVVSLISDPRFMRFVPSVLASATMLHIINTIHPCFETELLTTLNIDKDQLDDCFKLISDSTTGSFYKSNKRKLRSTVPGSPNGVIDVCFSSDSSCDSWAATIVPPPETSASVSSSPEPLSKKIKVLCPSFSL